MHAFMINWKKESNNILKLDIVQETNPNEMPTSPLIPSFEDFEIDTDPNIQCEMKNIETCTLDTNSNEITKKRELKSLVRMYMALMENEDDINNLEHNVEMLKQCKFSMSDFAVKDNSKKIKFDKQADFMPKNRKIGFNKDKLHSCLYPSLKAADKKSIEASHGLINEYLDILSENFSDTNKIIYHESTLNGQKIFKANFSREKRKGEYLAFVPFMINDEWCLFVDFLDGQKLVFSRNMVTGLPDDFKIETLIYDDPWLSGYSILLMCTQILTHQKIAHSFQLLNRFRKFLFEITFDDSSLLCYCYKCFKFLNKAEACTECPLVFCASCILNNICPRH